MRNYQSVDVTKLLMALCVVTIHTNYFHSLSNPYMREPLVDILSSAVPFFFITTGYFITRKLDNCKWFEQVKIIIQYVRKLLPLYLIWGIITFFGCELLNCNYSDDAIITFVYNFIFRGIYHLWYIWAVIITIPFLLIANRFIKNKYLMLGIGIGAYLFNRVYTHWGSMEDPGLLFSWLTFIYKGGYVNLTGICMALCFLSMGAFFTKVQILSLRKSLLLMLMGGGIYAL